MASKSRQVGMIIASLLVAVAVQSGCKKKNNSSSVAGMTERQRQALANLLGARGGNPLRDIGEFTATRTLEKIEHIGESVSQMSAKVANANPDRAARIQLAAIRDGLLREAAAEDMLPDLEPVLAGLDQAKEVTPQQLRSSIQGSLAGLKDRIRKQSERMRSIGEAAAKEGFATGEDLHAFSSMFALYVNLITEEIASRSSLDIHEKYQGKERTPLCENVPGPNETVTMPSLGKDSVLLSETEAGCMARHIWLLQNVVVYFTTGSGDGGLPILSSDVVPGQDLLNFVSLFARQQYVYLDALVLRLFSRIVALDTPGTFGGDLGPTWFARAPVERQEEIFAIKVVQGAWLSLLSNFAVEFKLGRYADNNVYKQSDAPKLSAFAAYGLGGNAEELPQGRVVVLGDKQDVKPVLGESKSGSGPLGRVVGLSVTDDSRILIAGRQPLLNSGIKDSESGYISIYMGERNTKDEKKFVPFAHLKMPANHLIEQIAVRKDYPSRAGLGTATDSRFLSAGELQRYMPPEGGRLSAEAYRQFYSLRHANGTMTSTFGDGCQQQFSRSESVLFGQYMTDYGPQFWLTNAGFDEGKDTYLVTATAVDNYRTNSKKVFQYRIQLSRGTSLPAYSPGKLTVCSPHGSFDKYPRRFTQLDGLIHEVDRWQFIYRPAQGATEAITIDKTTLDEYGDLEISESGAVSPTAHQSPMDVEYEALNGDGFSGFPAGVKVLASVDGRKNMGLIQFDPVTLQSRLSFAESNGMDVGVPRGKVFYGGQESAQDMTFDHRSPMPRMAVIGAMRADPSTQSGSGTATGPDVSLFHTAIADVRANGRSIAAVSIRQQIPLKNLGFNAQLFTGTPGGFLGGMRLISMGSKQYVVLHSAANVANSVMYEGADARKVTQSPDLVGVEVTPPMQGLVGYLNTRNPQLRFSTDGAAISVCRLVNNKSCGDVSSEDASGLGSKVQELATEWSTCLDRASSNSDSGKACTEVVGKDDRGYQVVFSTRVPASQSVSMRGSLLVLASSSLAQKDDKVTGTFSVYSLPRLLQMGRVFIDPWRAAGSAQTFGMAQELTLMQSIQGGELKRPTAVASGPRGESFFVGREDGSIFVGRVSSVTPLLDQAILDYEAKIMGGEAPTWSTSAAKSWQPAAALYTGSYRVMNNNQGLTFVKMLPIPKIDADRDLSSMKAELGHSVRSVLSPTHGAFNKWFMANLEKLVTAERSASLYAGVLCATGKGQMPFCGVNPFSSKEIAGHVIRTVSMGTSLQGGGFVQAKGSSGAPNSGIGIDLDVSVQEWQIRGATEDAKSIGLCRLNPWLPNLQRPAGEGCQLDAMR